MSTVTERRKEMNEGLANDIKEIKGMLSELQRAEAARVEREKNMCTDVENLKDTVNGNGKPGLKTDVELLKTSEKKRAAFQNALAIALTIEILLQFVK